MSQLEALGWTLGIELAVVAVLAVGFRLWPRAMWGRVMLVAAAASLLSHPWAWWANGALRPVLPFASRAAIVEGTVVAFEAVVYAWATRLSWGRAVLVSAVANATSFGIGLLLAR